MIKHIKGLLFPVKSKWQDVAIHTAGAFIVLIQVREKANGAKQFRSVRVTEFFRGSDITQEFLDEIQNALSSVKSEFTAAQVETIIQGGPFGASITAGYTPRK